VMLEMANCAVVNIIIKVWVAVGENDLVDVAFHLVRFNVI